MTVYTEREGKWSIVLDRSLRVTSIILWEIFHKPMLFMVLWKDMAWGNTYDEYEYLTLSSHCKIVAAAEAMSIISVSRHSVPAHVGGLSTLLYRLYVKSLTLLVFNVCYRIISSPLTADRCETWLKCEDPFLQSYLEKFSQLPSCPCTYPHRSKSVWDDGHQRYFEWKDPGYSESYLMAYHTGRFPSTREEGHSASKQRYEEKKED